MTRQNPAAPVKVDALTVGSAVASAAVAGLYGIAVAIIGVFGTVNALTATTVTIPQPVAVDIATESGGVTRLVEGTYRMADITVAGAPTAVRALLSVSTALDAIMHLTVAFGVIMLCIALIRARPFMPAMVRTLTVISFALVICGTLSTGLLGFANMEVAHSLDRPEFPMMANLDFTAGIIGVVLALVATAFKIGEHLQRDTEGLI